MESGSTAPTVQGEEGEEEVKVSETKSFFLYHPCYCLRQLLRALFRCLGFQEMSLKAPSDVAKSSGSHNQMTYHQDDDVPSPTAQEAADSKCLRAPSDVAEDSGSNTQMTYQDDDVPSPTAQEAADPPSSTINQQIVASALIVHNRRSGLSTGPGPQIN